MILGQLHTGITVSSLDSSIEFYTKVLGMKLVAREPVRKSRGERLGVPGAVVQLAVLEYGKGSSIELIQYHEPDSPNSYGASVNSIGHVHIAFEVDDIEAQILHMQEHNVEFIGGPVYETITEGPVAGWKWIYFKDPDGTNLEFIECSKQKEYLRQHRIEAKTV